MDMPARQPNARAPLRRTQLALLATAGLLLTAWFIGFVGGEILQFFGSRELARQVAAYREDARGEGMTRLPRTTDDGIVIPDGRTGNTMFPRGAAEGTACIGKIEIPRIGLSTLIVEGTGSLSLLSGAGHLVGSALPGEAGNVVLAAHRDTFFRDLRGVREGDLVRIQTPRRVVLYRVDTISVVDPKRTESLARTEAPRLTLVTCYPFSWIGRAPKRFIVTASEVG